MQALAADELSRWTPHTLRPGDAAVVLPRFQSGPDGPERYDAAWFTTYQEQRHTRQSGDFATVRQRLQGAGANWRELSVVGVRVEHELKGGATLSDVFATVRSGGADYVIELDDCMRLPRGWIAVDGMRWRPDLMPVGTVRR